jgi:hypothetical protein
MGKPMRKLLLVLAVTSLTGCAAIDAYLMKYDVNEYASINDIRTVASLSKDRCDKENDAKMLADAIAVKTFNFQNYTQYLPHNEPTKKAAVELNKIAQGLNAQYKLGTVSPAFCKVKFESIEKSAETIQKTVGDKPR